MQVSMTVGNPTSSAFLPVPDFGDLEGRKTTHWSTYVQIVGVLAATILLIAGVVLANPSLLVPGALFLLTSGVGVYFTHTFSQYSQLESYIELFKERNEELQAAISREKRNNQTLKTLNEALEAKQIEWKNEEIELQKKWKEETESLNRDLLRLQETVKKLGKEREEISKNLGSRIAALEENNSLLIKNLGTFKARLSDYTDNNQKLSQTNESLRKQIEILKGSILQSNRNIQELDQQNKILKKEIHTLEEACQNPHFDAQKLHEEIGKLSDAAKQIESSNHRADSTLLKLEELTKTIEADL